MPHSELDERAECARDAIARASALALSYFRDLASLTVSEKAPQSLVSEADTETEQLLRSALLRAFPEDGWVGEETGNRNETDSRGVWVVDPIDGTQPFLLGLPTWCVSVAYVLDGTVELGFLAKPEPGEFFEARRGHGAWLDGKQLHVAAASSVKDGITGIGCSSRDGAVIGGIVSGLLDKGGVFRQTSSGACDLSHVATGQYVGVVNQSLRSWDCLAALCLISEAGGVVTDFVRAHGIDGYGPVVAAPATVFGQLGAILEDAFMGAGLAQPNYLPARG